MGPGYLRYPGFLFYACTDLHIMLTARSCGFAFWTSVALIVSSCHAQGAGFDAGNAYNVCLVKGFRTGVGGMRLPVWRPYLLLKDGTAYENPQSAPDNFDLATSRQSEAGRWGTWTRQGGGVALNMPNRNPMTGTHCVSPAPAGMTLQGSYKHVGGGGTMIAGGHASFMRSDTYQFYADGHFTGSSSSGLVSPGASTASSDAGRVGHYKIHDYSIDLRYDDGSEAQLFFYTDGQQLVHIGEDDFVPAGD
jgi:hypothetical protein